MSYYRSVNTPISSGDTKVGSATFTALSANGGAASTTVRTNAQGVGTYYYGACIDGTAVCKTGPSVIVTAAPNLILANLAVDSQTIVKPRTPIVVSVDVKNTGTAVSGSGRITYYRSNDPVIDTATGDVAFAADRFNAIPASGTSSETVDVNAPAGIGTYYYGACINSTTVCTAGIRVIVTPLVLKSLAVDPRTARPNVPITVSVNVRNEGAAVSHSGEIKYYQSDDVTIDAAADTEVGTASFNGIPGGTEPTETVSTNAPNIHSTYYYGACIKDSAICTTGASVEVGIPNLVLEGSVNVSTQTAIPNQNIDVSVDVKNTGTAISSSGKVSYYRSTSTPVTSSDTKVGSDDFTALTVNGSASTAFRTPAPGIGTYYYGACIDGTTICKTGPSVIVAAGTPNLILEGSVNVSPLTAVPNDPIDVSVTVKNTGTAISSNGAVSYYRSVNTPISSGDTKVGSASFTALAANGGEASTTVRTNAPGVGTYYYGACIDGTTVCKTGPSVTVTATPTPNLVLEDPVNVSL